MSRLCWQKWEQSWGLEEWTRWDVGEAWFLAVVREKGQWLWRWTSDYAPSEGQAVEHSSWALTRKRAMAQAEAWAEKNAAKVRDA